MRFLSHKSDGALSLRWIGWINEIHCSKKLEQKVATLYVLCRTVAEDKTGKDYILGAFMFHFISSASLWFLFACEPSAPPEYVPVDFRSDESFLGAVVEMDDLTFKVPQGFTQLKQSDFEQLKVGLKKALKAQGEGKFFESELEHAFYTEGQSSILVSVIDDSKVFEQLNDSYTEFLTNLPNSKHVKRTTMTVNGLKTIQFQINREAVTLIKLFFLTDNRVVSIEFVMNNSEYHGSLKSLESSISSITKKTSPILLENIK